MCLFQATLASRYGVDRYVSVRAVRGPRSWIRSKIAPAAFSDGPRSVPLVDGLRSPQSDIIRSILMLK